VRTPNRFAGRGLLISLIALVLPLIVFTANAGTYVQFRTIWGDIEVELYDQDKPITVRNFLRYAQSGLYRDSIFHRCPTNRFTGVTDFVVQGGGIYVADRNSTNAGLDFIPTFGNIPNEFGVGRRFSNIYGTIAMAKVAGDTNSASSQWFFNLNNNSFLDTTDSDNFFTVFGRVVRGTNVLNAYRGRSINNRIKNLGGLLSELPVTYQGTRLPTVADLEYVDISLLNVHVRLLTNQTREISWNSVAGKTNYVEFTTNLPSAWEVLTNTNGTGEALAVTDNTVSSIRRFYRVRVDF